MAEFDTKYFGKIIISTDDEGGEADVTYNNKNIHLSADEDFINGNKVNVFLEIINNYDEINEIAKKAILENYSKNETIEYFFESTLNIQKKQSMELKNAIEKLDYPDVSFYMFEDTINVCFTYAVSTEYSIETLDVEMDEKINIISFYHDSSND